MNFSNKTRSEFTDEIDCLSNKSIIDSSLSSIVMSSLEQDLMPFLDELPFYTGDLFYDFVKKVVGFVEGEIMEIQQIKNVRILLQTSDVFSFFKINNKDIFKLKQKACLIDDDLSYVVRPGIRANIEEFIEVLKDHYNPITTSSRTDRMNSCICGFFNANGKDIGGQSNSFTHAFLTNFTKNIDRSGNNYQFDEVVGKFASVLNILAGHQAYEFVRINLPGSLPSVTTLKKYNQDVNLGLNEGEFRFDCLREHLDLIDSNHVFVVCSVET